MKYLGLLRKGSALAVAGVVWVPGMAQAGTGGGTIMFEPPGVTAIPTLGGVMLVILSLLLAFVGFLILRRNQRVGGGTALSFVAGAVVAGSLASGAGGIKLVQHAQAQEEGCQPECVFDVENPQGGPFPIFGFASNTYWNKSGVTLRVSDLDRPSVGCSLRNGEFNLLQRANEVPQGPACEVGEPVGDGEACVVLCGGPG